MANLVVTLRYSDDVERVLLFCKKKGINNIRINLARSNITKNMELLKEIDMMFDQPSILLDLPGNKRRLSKFGGESISVKKGDIIQIHSTKENQLYVSHYQDFYENTNLNDILIFGDNDAKAEVIEKYADKSILKILSGNKIKSHTGYINYSNYIPMTDIEEQEKALIEKFDNKNITWGISFSDTAERIDSCKKYIKKGRVVAKIETRYGIKNIDEISDKVDGLMLARGDLSNFYDQDCIDKKLYRKILDISKNKSIDCVVATNLFKSVADKGIMNSKETIRLKDYKKQADYIVTNETSYSKYWKEIVESYYSI